jgi:hypothetical protein
MVRRAPEHRCAREGHKAPCRLCTPGPDGSSRIHSYGVDVGGRGMQFSGRRRARRAAIKKTEKIRKDVSQGYRGEQGLREEAAEKTEGVLSGVCQIT